MSRTLKVADLFCGAELGQGGVDVEPFLVTLRNSRGRGPESSVTSLEDPLRTITCGRNHTLIEPFVIPQGGGGVARSTHEPLPTVATDGAIGVVEPFIVPQDSGAPARSAADPLPTLRTTSRGVAIVEPFILVKRQDDAVHSLDEPLTTITNSGRNHFLVEPYLVESNHAGERGARSVECPLPTITQKNGVGLVEPQIEGGRLVLLHRMLQPEELALGQDFDGYEFTGTREQQTKQIGNAVPIKLARAITTAAFYDLSPIAIEECMA